MDSPFPLLHSVSSALELVLGTSTCMSVIDLLSAMFPTASWFARLTLVTSLAKFRRAPSAVVSLPRGHPPDRLDPIWSGST